MTTLQEPCPDAEEVLITLFVACYNEEANIVATLETVAAACKTAGLTYEIIIIDDASTDRSVEIIRDYIASHPDMHVTRA